MVLLIRDLIASPVLAAVVAIASVNGPYHSRSRKPGPEYWEKKQIVFQGGAVA